MKKCLFLFLACVLLLCGCSSEKKDGGEESIDVLNYIEGLKRPEDYVIIGNYKDIKVNRITISDGDVASYKKDVTEKYAYFKPITERDVVQTGDNINISYISYLNDKAFEGGSGSADLVVGDGEFVFPQVEQYLNGMKVGSSISVDVQVPEDYFSQGLRGKTIKMAITVKQIQEKTKTTPELDVELVKKHYNVETLEEFDTLVRKELENQALDKMMEGAWKAVLANCEIIEYPNGIVDKYVDEMYNHYKKEAASYGADVSLLIGDEKEWREEATRYAEDYYKSELVMFSILDREYGRDISDKEYKEKLNEYAASQGTTPEKVEEKHGKDGVTTSIYWDKVMQYVWDKAEISE